MATMIFNIQCYWKKKHCDRFCYTA